MAPSSNPPADSASSHPSPPNSSPTTPQDTTTPEISAVAENALDSTAGHSSPSDPRTLPADGPAFPSMSRDPPSLNPDFASSVTPNQSHPLRSHHLSRPAPPTHAAALKVDSKNPNAITSTPKEQVKTMDSEQKVHWVLGQQPEIESNPGRKLKVRRKVKEPIERAPEPEPRQESKQSLRQDSTQEMITVKSAEYTKLKETVAKQQTSLKGRVDYTEDLEGQIKELEGQVNNSKFRSQKLEGQVKKLKKRRSKRMSTADSSSFLNLVETDLGDEESEDLKKARRELEQLTDHCQDCLDKYLTAEKRAQALEIKNRALAKENEQIIPLKLDNYRLEEQVEMLQSQMTESMNELHRLVEAQNGIHRKPLGADISDPDSSGPSRQDLQLSIRIPNFHALDEELPSSLLSSGIEAFTSGFPTPGSTYTTSRPSRPGTSGRSIPLPLRSGIVASIPHTPWTGRRVQQSLPQEGLDVDDDLPSSSKIVHKGIQRNYSEYVSQFTQTETPSYANSITQSDSDSVKDCAAQGSNQSLSKSAIQGVDLSPAEAQDSVQSLSRCAVHGVDISPAEAITQGSVQSLKRITKEVINLSPIETHSQRNDQSLTRTAIQSFSLSPIEAEIQGDNQSPTGSAVPGVGYRLTEADMHDIIYFMQRIARTHGIRVRLDRRRSYVDSVSETDSEPGSPDERMRVKYQPFSTPTWMWIVHAFLVLVMIVSVVMASKERTIWLGANEATQRKLSWINGGTFMEPSWLAKVPFTKQELLGVSRGRLG